MKKLIKVLMVFIMCLSFVGCAQKSDFDKKVDNVIKYTNQYLDGDITKDEAYERISDISSLMSSMDKNSKQLSKNIYVDTIVLELIDSSPDEAKIREALSEIE